MRINFQEVAITAHKTVRCDGGCGRQLRRQKRFWQTLNPFNVTVNGTPKTRADILPELGKEAEKWQRVPERCSRCGPREEGKV